MPHDTKPMNFCLKCALVVGSLMALGATPTPDEVDHAKVVLCLQAGYSFETKDELLDSAFAMIGGDPKKASGALGTAIFEFMRGDWQTCPNPEATKRLNYLMHDEHENEMGAGS